MEFPEFNPFVFGLEINGFGIRWYALAYVVGILLGWWYGIRLARNEPVWGARAPVMSREKIDDLVLWVTLGVIAGGRIGSMIFYNTSALWESPLEIFKIWRGGMSFHGGLLGVAIAMFAFARFNKISVFRISDLVAPAVPIGLFFGRIANFINGELWGRPTDLPWGFYVGNSPLPLHPSQLYEAALEGLALFLILFFACRRFGVLRKPGMATGIFLAGYGVFRSVVEFFWRAPDEGLENLPLGLNMGVYLSLPMIALGVWLIMRAKETVDAGETIAAAAPQPAPATAKPATKKKSTKPRSRL